jgi:predicted TIM-barrel fold metal-dependent hydrolase
MQYRLNEAVGRPFDSTVNVARMIASGVFDRHPKLQVLIVHMGGGLASIVGRLEFNWHLNYNGIKNPPAGKPYTNKRSPFDYCSARRDRTVRCGPGGLRHGLRSSALRDQRACADRRRRASEPG